MPLSIGLVSSVCIGGAGGGSDERIMQGQSRIVFPQFVVQKIHRSEFTLSASSPTHQSSLWPIEVEGGT